MNNPLQKNRFGSDGPHETDFADDAPPAGGRRTLCVLGLLVATALLFSYLGAYAVTDALIAADVMPRRPADPDLRPRLFLLGSVTLMGCFGACAIAARILSHRQLQRIDAMVDEG